MIKKLEMQEIEQPTGSEYTIIERVPATSEQMHDKINELCDIINDITDWIKSTDETIVKYGMKPIPEKIAQEFKNLQDHRPNMVMDDPFGPHPNIYEQGRPAESVAENKECSKMEQDETPRCPFCNKPLQPTLRQSDEYWCENYDCPGTNIEWVGSQKLWQELIRTKKLLEIESSEHDMCHTQMLKTTEKLERTRKALDVAVDALKDIRCVYTGDQTTKPSTMFGRAASALNKIQDLEQKDK